MPAIMGIIGPLLPYLMLGLGAIAAYIGIKHKGKVEAQAQFQKQQEVVAQKVQQDVAVAVGKDQQIDQKVEAKIEDIKKADAIPQPSSPTKFKF